MRCETQTILFSPISYFINYKGKNSIHYTDIRHKGWTYIILIKIIMQYKLDI